MHSKLCADDHERTSDIVAPVADEAELLAFAATKTFFDSQHIGKCLCRMVQVGQTIIYRNAGVFRKDFDIFLLEAAEFDGIEHAAQHARSIFDRFL